MYRVRKYHYESLSRGIWSMVNKATMVLSVMALLDACILSSVLSSSPTNSRTVLSHKLRGSDFPWEYDGSASGSPWPCELLSPRQFSQGVTSHSGGQ